MFAAGIDGGATEPPNKNLTRTRFPPCAPANGLPYVIVPVCTSGAPTVPSYTVSSRGKLARGPYDRLGENSTSMPCSTPQLPGPITFLNASNCVRRMLSDRLCVVAICEKLPDMLTVEPSTISSALV